MFDRLERNIARYEQHLVDTGTQGSLIEQAFVGYVLTLIYAEFENAIKSAINDRCHIESDPPLNSFVEWSTNRIIRSLKISDLSGFLRSFDDKYNDRFQATKDKNHQTQVSWDRIIANRQAFAHEAPTNMTLPKFKRNSPRRKAS